MGNVKKSVAERIRHKRQYDNMMNEIHMQSKEGNVDSSKALDASLVVTECNAIESENSNLEHAFNKSVNESSGIVTGKQDTSSSLGNYITHAMDADIRPANDQVPFAEVQLTAQHNVLANEQQHTEQSKPIYDTYLLKKVDSNTTPDSTNMSHKGGEIDQDAEQYQVKSLLLNAEFFKTKDMVEKEVYNELSNRFLQLEKHCISLEISIQQKEESFKCNKPLLQNSVSPTPYVPPSKKDYKIMFQPLFDEYFNPPPRVVSPDLTAVAAPRAIDPAGSPSSTTIDQDVPSTSTSPTTQEI
uniref:Uncharacterized protein n=1 Tax=Tanacetum cinerariifolium TaxID=118510 RepID=A0A699GWZ7_TANCI|nr:hypothetical protein [Tanacetum cinerariifolium]